MVVVGAGIVGACLTYELARAGLPVALIDRAHGVPPATARSFGWFGGFSDGDWPGASEDLRHLVLDDHRRLATEVPGMAHRWTGSLTWPAPATAAHTPDRDASTPGRYLVDRAAVAAMEPELRDVPEAALHIPSDGGIDPLTAVPALIRAAQALGARYLPDTPYTPGLAGDADAVIFAAGSATGALAGVDLPVRAAPAFGMRFAGPPGLIRSVISTPDFNVREVRPGRYLLFAPWIEDSDADAVAARCLHRLRETFRVDGRLRPLGYEAVLRPLPANGPVVGAVRPGRYVAVLHAGITFAPTVARLLTAELITGEPAPELHRARPASS